MKPIQALVISNGIEGLNALYRTNERVRYTLAEVEPGFCPDLSPFDLLIVPNGSDHVAMYRIRESVRAFLDRGGALFCFDGWFTDWIPGHRWVMDNSKKTIDMRYRLKEDPHQLGKRFRIEDLNFSHGISGWWSCGYLEPAPGSQVLIEDTWGRPLAVIDETTTPGMLILTASGPAADYSYATTDDDRAIQAMSDLYGAFLWLAGAHIAKEKSPSL